MNVENDNIIEKYMSVELWHNVSKELQIEAPILCEMVESDHAFLCGMIKEKRPKKIIELGVAEGGTTAVIMKCLSLLDLESEVYSVDLNEKLYCDKSRDTGYLWKDLSNYIKGKSTHVFKLGKTIAGCIDEIGADVDFVIIDTTHVLPGELLDFLCLLPYMTQDAVVVLHDLSLNYISSFSDDMITLFNAKDYNATKILYTTVTAKKWFYFEDEPGFNIAAFTVTRDTIKYIADCFCALSLTWGYRMSEVFLNEYRDIFLRYYSEQCIKLYDLAVKANNYMVSSFKIVKKIALYDYLPKNVTFTETKFERLRKAKRVIIYGAGIVAIEIIKILQRSEIQIYAIAVSDIEQNVKKICGIDVRNITEFAENNSIEVIIASILDNYIQEMECNLRKLGIKNVMKVDRISFNSKGYAIPQFYTKKHSDKLKEDNKI